MLALAFTLLSVVAFAQARPQPQYQYGQGFGPGPFGSNILLSELGEWLSGINGTAVPRFAEWVKRQVIEDETIPWFGQAGPAGGAEEGVFSIPGNARGERYSTVTRQNARPRKTDENVYYNNIEGGPGSNMQIKTIRPTEKNNEKTGSTGREQVAGNTVERTVEL